MVPCETEFVASNDFLIAGKQACMATSSRSIVDVVLKIKPDTFHGGREIVTGERWVRRCVASDDDAATPPTTRTCEIFEMQPFGR